MTDSNDVIAAHAEHYQIVEEAALRRVERKVIGSDYGATSYTTRAQADRLARHLDLRAGMLVLDVGSGAGWPGIYLAATTGARVVLTDMPLEGLAVASRRIQEDHVNNCDVVAASGDLLPFPDHTFDAVASSDVLCWIPDKLSVLRASHRVLKPGGTTVFAVISVGDGLNAEQREEAIAAGPVHVDADLTYPELMRAAGFEHVEATDVTAEYLETLTAWRDEWEAESVELRRIVGDDDFNERQANRKRAIRASEDGLLRRYLISGVRT